MVWAGAGRHGLTDTDWIYLKFSKVSLSLQTEFIISRQSELTDMKDNETKIDCTLILGDITPLSSYCILILLRYDLLFQPS